MSVFSKERDIIVPEFELHRRLKYNSLLEMPALEFLSYLPDSSVPLSILDPQYRGVLDAMDYGNEGEGRGVERAKLQQMTEIDIAEIIAEIQRVLIPKGHLFLWVDKYHLCTGVNYWLKDLKIVDMVTWDKGKIGMGYRTRRKSEYLVIAQKLPLRAKGVWVDHSIPDVWREKVLVQKGSIQVHRKPIKLQSKLIAAVTNINDVVIDPAAGSFSVLEATQLIDRRFLGCDISLRGL